MVNKNMKLILKLLPGTFQALDTSEVEHHGVLCIKRRVKHWVFKGAVTLFWSNSRPSTLPVSTPSVPQRDGIRSNILHK